MPLAGQKFAYLDSVLKCPEVHTTAELVAKLEDLRQSRGAELYLCKTMAKQSGEGVAAQEVQAP